MGKDNRPVLTRTALNCVDVVVPGPWWNTLTYLTKEDSVVTEGARVRVPLGRGTRVGFVSGAVYTVNGSIKGLKPIEEVLDDGSVLGDELWNLAGWIGNTFLCGTGEALQLMCPANILKGEPMEGKPMGDKSLSSIINSSENRNDHRKPFQEALFFNPVDEERFAYYRNVLSGGGKRTLLLFPEAKTASVFFAGMSKPLKADALLWPSGGGKKLWDAWKKTASGEVRLVVGSGGAAFAPLCFDEAIIDDESNLAYVFQRAPKISARSLVGRRALTLRARLLLGGRMPSAKTYIRSKPVCGSLPRRDSLVFVDVGRSYKKEVRGVEGGLPITPSLLERTKSTLEKGRSVFWIMDRKGQAGEVYCSDCGASLYCSRCSGAVRCEGTGGALGVRCVKCGAKGELPLCCPVCRGSLLLGKRPGLEALLSFAVSFMKGGKVQLDEPSRAIRASRTDSGKPALILGTRRLLSLCDSLDVGLIAWLDLDAEARKADYNAGFQAFSMVWESCWRGLPRSGERVVLMQVRDSGNSWRNALRLGWGHFWGGELRERERLGLPPYGLLIQVDLPKKENRKTLTDLLENEGIIVMDSGEENSSLWTTTKSTEKLRAALAPRFEISCSRAGFPVVTVWAE